MEFKNGWSKNRNIIEFSQDLLWRKTGATNKYYFKKENNRWYWGWLIGINQVDYQPHPYATQREAKEAAREYNASKRSEVDSVLTAMRSKESE